MSQFFNNLPHSKEMCFICHETENVHKVCDKCTFSTCPECILPLMDNDRMAMTCTQCAQPFEYSFLSHYIFNRSPLDDKLIKKYFDKLEWPLVCKYSKLSTNMLKKYKNHVDWKVASRYQELGPKDIDLFHPYIHFDEFNNNAYFIRNKHLKYDMDKKLFNGSINLPQPLGHYFHRTVFSLPPEEQFKNVEIWKAVEPYLSFIALSLVRVLTIEFIETFKQKLDWQRLSCTYPLTKTFLVQFEDFIDWNYVSINRSWSTDLVVEYQRKIDMHLFFEHGIGKKLVQMATSPSVKIEIVDRNGILTEKSVDTILNSIDENE